MNDPQPEGHMASHIGRRKFLATLGGAAAWPLAARAQQPGTPVVGLLGGGSPSLFIDAPLLQGLREAGYIEHQNIVIEQRWARGAYERLPALAAELVALRADVIVTFGTPTTHAAKTASLKSTPPIPVVFAMGGDPVAEGFVESLHRPGGNLTGVTSITAALASKRLELMREFVHDRALAVLLNPDNPLSAGERHDTEAAARGIGQRLEDLAANNKLVIVRSFAQISYTRVTAVFE